MDAKRIPVFRLWYVFIALLVLAACCASLLWANRSLQKKNRLLVEEVARVSGTRGPPVGSSISFLHGLTISGQDVRLDLAARESGTLLLVLSPVCPYCGDNFHNWRDILRLVPSDQVIWADVTGRVDARYLASVAIPANSNVIRLYPEVRTLYDLNVTPTTLLLGPHGLVSWKWSGVMSDEEVKQLRGLLKSANARIQ